ncbi:cation:proton antiporter [Reichenbachiella sp. MALMAid0571]|uniref:cation:proton antiporter domain-containing protein n=1 Tax=Reichenbachiella sp. MALMAid0571 TaxID=3143939 RepID=UPI0032DF6A0F
MELFSPDNKELLILVLGFVIITVASSRIALLFKKIRLPFITGFLFTGIICGAYFLGLIPEASRVKLNFINEMALAFIAFAAGSELYLRELRSRFNSIKWNTIGQLTSTFVIGSVAVFFMSDYIPFMTEMNTESKVAISMLSGIIFVARSPASAIAIINELRAKGPFTQTVMGVTVLKDFIVIVLFAVCLSLAKTMTVGEAFNILSIVFLIGEIFISLLIGRLLGHFLKLALSLKIKVRVKAGIIILLGYSIYEMSYFVHHFTETHFIREIALEPLLICIVGSLYVTNYTKFRPEFLRILSETGPMVYAAFFTLTGASLSIETLLDVWPVALVLFAVRLVSLIGGSYFGGMMAGDPMRFCHLGWMPYITQAGVALGLSTVIANEFPEWGGDFYTVVIAIIVINQVVGPPLFKWALGKVGEDRSRGDFGADGSRDAIIYGYESQSVALANQLMSKGWSVIIASRQKKGAFEEPEGLDIRYIKDLSLESLNSLDADKAEAIVCMLSDKKNYEICELSYHHFGTPDMIVRLTDRYYTDRFLALGVKVVDPSMAIVNLLDHFVRSPQATSLLLGMETGQDTRDLELLNKDLHGIALRNLRLPPDVIILSIKRGGHMIISHGYTRLRSGDVVTFVGSNESLEQLSSKFSN